MIVCVCLHWWFLFNSNNDQQFTPTQQQVELPPEFHGKKSYLFKMSTKPLQLRTVKRREKNHRPLNRFIQSTLDWWSNPWMSNLCACVSTKFGMLLHQPLAKFYLTVTSQFGKRSQVNGTQTTFPMFHQHACDTCFSSFLLLALK